MKKQKASEFYSAANAWVEKYYGSRAPNSLAEGNADRAELKARLLDQFVEARDRIDRVMKDYPDLSDRTEVRFIFPK